MEEKPALILTLALGDQDQLYFNALRKKHFPAERNFIDAHVTLFHALPWRDEVFDLTSAVSKTQMPFRMLVEGPVSLGKGVAYRLVGSPFAELHQRLQKAWMNFLSPQDRQTKRPHITVQNKVSVTAAGALLNELQEGFAPFMIEARGLQLWEYMGGPWKFLQRFTFEHNPAI